MFHPTERVSTDDLMSLASERGSTPIQVGAVVMLDARESLVPGLVVDAIADRITAVPRPIPYHPDVRILLCADPMGDQRQTAS